jgi:hypothetical protein
VVRGESQIVATKVAGRWCAGGVGMTRKSLVGDVTRKLLVGDVTRKPLVDDVTSTR